MKVHIEMVVLLTSILEAWMRSEQITKIPQLVQKVEQDDCSVLELYKSDDTQIAFLSPLVSSPSQLAALLFAKTTDLHSVISSELIAAEFILAWAKLSNAKRYSGTSPIACSGRAKPLIIGNELFSIQCIASTIPSSIIPIDRLSDESGDIYLFGYGSLIWKHGVLAPFVDKQRWAYIRGWKRRFWQGSPDHRGTPLFPGRVVTLLPSNPNDIVWGIIFKIPRDRQADILPEILHREQAGYSEEMVPAQFGLKRFVNALVYRATEDNVWYLGDSSSIARDIRVSKGPSGSNMEYFQNLFEVLQHEGRADDHLIELNAQLSIPN